jgi:WD40 repeat protein/energy-coupling factor transporter ATP-binding protein EcfA2
MEKRREALVVGISVYDYGDLQEKKIPADHDAEEIAQRLREYGEFHVTRLPEGNRGVESKDLKQAISNLFLPHGNTLPTTALFFFAGHGLREINGLKTDGYLATTDTNEKIDHWGFPLTWLQRVLKQSKVQQQIVWLDCCYSGEILNFDKTELAELTMEDQGRSRFIIAASREFEPAQAKKKQHGLLTAALLKGLDPEQNSNGLVTNETLINVVEKELKQAKQQPLFLNPTQEIWLTGIRSELLTTVPESGSPYKGLSSFQVEDAPFFHGRKRFTGELLDKVKIAEQNFLAVLGASGSGKSSLLQAGLMYELQQGKRLSGSEKWKIRVVRPKDKPLEKPLQNLAEAFIDEQISDIERSVQLKHAEDAIKEGATGLARLIRASKLPRTVLIVDQFEEIFTVCKSETDRQNFITYLLSALELTENKFCVVLGMRDDFLGKCAAYRELIDKIQSNLVMVTPMTAAELTEAIIKPAQEVGRKIDENLVNAILKDLGVDEKSESSTDKKNTAEPGMLPLLEYTLEQLWQLQELNWLKLKAYNKLGGVQNTLENLASKAYEQLSIDEQQLADQIFIKLTQLGEPQEGTPDTRKQVRQQNLVAAKYSKALVDVDKVVQKLAEAKLIVTSQRRQGEEEIAVVDIAHEALIRHWSRLRDLVDKNREAIKTERKIQAAAEEWKKQGKSTDYLFKGSQLAQADEFQDNADTVTLSPLAEEFIQASQQERDRQEQLQQRELEKQKETNRMLQKRVFIAISFAVATVITSIFAFNQWQSAEAKAKMNKSLQLATASESSLNEDTTRSLLLAIQANLIQETPQAAQALWQAFQKNYEQLELEHNGTVLYAEFDPSNSNRVLTVSNDKTAKIWNLETPSQTPIILKEHTQSVNYGNFNPTNTNQVLTVSNDGTARLWDISNIKEPRVISLIRDGTEPIRYGRINPNNPKQLLTVSQRAAKLWDISNPQSPKVLTSLQGSKGEVWEGTSDPKNFNRLLITSNNGTARIWDLSSSNQFITLNHQGVVNGSFDPNNPKRVLTVGIDNMARIWNLDTPSPTSIVLKGHTKRVNYGSFNPTESNQVLTVSDDGTARLWDIKTGKELKSFITGQDKVLYLTFNPSDSNQFLTVSSDGKTKIWNIENSSVLFTLYGHTAPIRFATFDPKNPKRVLTTSEDKTARIWDVNEKAYTEIYNRKDKKGSSIVSAIFNPESQNKVLTIARDGTISNWNIDNPKENKTEPKKLDSLQYARIDPNNPNRIVTVNSSGIAKLTTDKSVIPLTATGRVESITFDSKNPNRILTVSDTTSTATVWDVSGNLPKKLQELTAPRSSPMNQGEFDPNDSNRVATVGGDGIVRIWNLDQTNQPEKQLAVSQDQLWHVSFDPKNSNRILTMGSNKVARIWDIASNKLITELTGHQDVVTYGSFDPNNSDRVLTISYDGTARVWDLRNPTNPLILNGDNQKLFYGNFDPNNSNRVITVNSEGITRIYKVGGKDLLSLAWNNASRCFNSKEETDYALLSQDFLKVLFTYDKDIQSRFIYKHRPYCK